MTDARLLADYVSSKLPAAPNVKPGYQHMGCALVDASFQAQERYTTVARRVSTIGELLRGQPTVTDLKVWLETHDAMVELDYAKPRKLRLLNDMVEVFLRFEIETQAGLRAVLTGDRRQAFRRALMDIHGVGPKTRDYVDIIAALDTGAAVDSRVRRVMKAAGIALNSTEYQRARGIIDDAASVLGWAPGAVDAALWELGAR